MKRKASGYHRGRWKLGFLLFILFAVLIFLKLQTFVMMPQYSFGYWSRPQSSPQNRKLAFLFLARNRMPLDIVWEQFFQGADKRNFSIYVHSRPGFVYSRRTTSCSFFYNRQLSKSILVDWGEASMIQAERLLLAEALNDTENERFILLSDSCIPLYNFTYTYDYIMSSPKSFLDSFLDNQNSRYNPKMYPTIQKDKWRKGSQWFVLLSTHAEIVASDSTVFHAFQNYCKRRPLPEFWRHQSNIGDPSKEHNCIPDEHYVQTLLAMHGVEDEIERRTLTYTLWNEAGNDRDRLGWHPATFKYSDASPKLLHEIKAIYSINYKTEYRTEWCSSNRSNRPCFLFARKFTRGAALRLLNQSLLVA